MNASPKPLEHEGNRHLRSVDEYVRMEEAGIFAPDARVELIEGGIYDTTPIGISHAFVVDRLNQEFVLALSRRAVVRTQSPVILGDRSAPQPDLAILKRDVRLYRDRHPVVADILLLVEVADSSPSFDRRRKMPLYARHGVTIDLSVLATLDEG